MKFAMKITEESLEYLTVWNAGLTPDAEVINADCYLVTGTDPEDQNEIMSRGFFDTELKFVNGEIPNTFCEVEEI